MVASTTMVIGKVLTTFASFVTLWTCVVDAYENGAPCAAQHNLHPSSIYHGESRDLRRSPPPYRFFIAEFDDLDIRTYTPGRVYTLRIIALDGAHFRGFLIQPRLATKEGSLIGNLRAGGFLVDQAQMDEYGIQFQECAPFKNDSITHRNGTLKYFLETKWTVEKNYGPIQFVLTMVQEQDEFWEQWRPTTGLLLPDDRNNNEETSVTSGVATEEDAELKKIKLLSQKLEYHKAKKTNGQIGFVAHDQSETDDEEGAAAASAIPPPSPVPSKKKQPGKATTNVQSPADATTEAPESEEESDEPSNQTETATAPKKPALTRLPTPKPPAENPAGSGAGEEAGDEEEGSEESTQASKVASPITDHKLNATTKTGLKPQNEEETGEEEETETEEASKSPLAVTKAPFRIPLSSLVRLRELFKQGQQKNKNYTLSPEKISEFAPTPNPDEETEEDAEETTRATKSPKAIGRPKPTLPAANRIEFPTLPPFPVVGTKASKTTGDEETEVADGSPPIPRLPQTGEPEEGGEEDSASPRSVPPKLTKPVQPVLRLLKGATVPPDAEGETDETVDDDDKEVVNEKPVVTAPKKPKSSPKTASGSSTTTLDPDFEDITSPLPTAEAVPLDESPDDSTEPSATTRPAGAKPPKPTSLPKVGEETEADLLPPAASALNEENGGNADSSSTPTTTDDSTTPPAPAAKARPSNGTIPVRRTVLVDGTNSTVEEENDSSILKEQDFCSSSPCLNKATCLSLADEDRYECKCEDGWTGKNCDLRDFCGKKNPCQNNGHCVNEDYGYTCNCTQLWVGKNCENKCPSDLCKNGGTCTLSESNGGYACTCKPGFTGNQCETDINECEPSPCQNGGTCQDKVNAFKCLCVDGYMGDKCHRPCQNIYKSCSTWGEEGRCESTRHTTRWFDINCGVTCGQCVYKNETVKTLSPLPPVLEPLYFLIGRWTVNTSHLQRFPIDFSQGNAGYYEEIEFAPVNVPMFGTPSINYTAIAYNNQFPDDVVVTHGFMTLKPNISPVKVALMSTGNEGLTMIEEGTLPNYYTLEMKADYIAPIPAIAQKMPTLAKRQFTLYGGFLRETVERQSSNGVTEYFTKYFYKGAEFQIY